MKTEYKAILASFVVMALCLTAVSGVTYSWFSDTEENPITVDTAVIDIDARFSNVAVDFTVNPTTPETTYDPAVYSTNAAAGLPPQTLIIDNMLANRTITATYTIDNDNSTVNSMYRLYIKQDTLPDTILNNGLKFYVDDTQIIFVNGIGFVVGDEDTGVLLQPDDVKTFAVKIVADETLTYLDDFIITMVAESYQVDYKYTGPVILRENTATISKDSVPQSLTFSGDVGDSEATADVSTPVSVTFPESVTATLIDAATDDITLTVTVDQRAIDSLVTLTLSGTTTDFGNDYVNIQVTLDGLLLDPVIVFNGEEDQPELKNVEYIGNQTIITFATNHFSEFVIYDECPTLVYVKDGQLTPGDDIFDALKNADAESTIIVYRDITYDSAVSTQTVNKTLTIEGAKFVKGYQPTVTINNIPGSYTSGLGAYISTSAGTTTWKNIGFEFNFLADHWKNACLGARDAGSLVVDGCTFGGDYLQVAIGSNSNKTHTVNDCTFNNPGIGYYPRTGTLNITNNDFVGTKNGIVLEPTVGKPYGTVTITGNTFELITKTDLEESAWTADHNGRSTGIAIYGSDNTWTAENLIITGNTFNNGSTDEDAPVVFAASGYVSNHDNYNSDTVNTIRGIINDGNNTIYDGAIYAYRTSSTGPSTFVFVTLDTAAVVDPVEA